MTFLNYGHTQIIKLDNTRGSGRLLNYWVIASDRWIRFTEPADNLTILENVEGRLVNSRYKTGEVIAQSDFKNRAGGAATEIFSQDAGTLSIATDYPYINSSDCVKFTSGAVIGNSCQGSLYAAITPLNESRLSVEGALQLDQALANIGELTVQFVYFDGSNVHKAIISYLGEANLKFQYYDSNGVAQDISGGGYSPLVNQRLYNTFKLITDVKNDKYVKFLFNNKEYDLSSYALFTSANGTAPNLKVSIAISTAAASAAIMRLGYIVLCKNEP